MINYTCCTQFIYFHYHVAACTSVTELEHDQTSSLCLDAALEGISTFLQCVCVCVGGTPCLQLFTGSPHASVSFSGKLRKPSRAAQISFLSPPDNSFLVFLSFCLRSFSFSLSLSLSFFSLVHNLFSFFFSIFSSFV